METKGVLILCLFIGGFFLLIGFAWGNSKRGYMAYATNELPNELYLVIFSNKTCTLLREIGFRERYFLVPTEAFGGKPIRPKHVVRKINSDKERRERGIPVLGYPPLVRNIRNC